MAETVKATPDTEVQGSSSKTWLIVLVVALVLCCVVVVCGGAGYWLWENGDRLIEDIQEWLTIISYV
jgi:hypothetical protein